MPNRILIAVLGLPGSGKGTQGNILGHVLQLKYFATGDLIREIYHSKKKDDFHKKIKQRYNKGMPQPDEVVNKVVRDKVKKLIGKQGLIIDAYPLSMGQVEGLDKIVRDNKISKFFVLYLDTNPKILVKRLSSRKICEKCNAPYAAAGKLTECSACGGKLITRPDDKPKVVKARIKEYKRRFKPILKYYQDKVVLLPIKGGQSIAAVHTDILNALRERGVF